MAIDKLYPKIEKSVSVAEVKKIIEEKIKEQGIALENIQDVAKNVFKNIIHEHYPNKVGVLLYSKSTTIVEMINSLPITIRERLILYVCEGSIRNNISIDANHKDYIITIDELLTKEPSIVEIKIIPDIYFYYLAKSKKIHIGLLGAHNVVFNMENPIRFINTNGSDLIYKQLKP